MKIPLYKRSLDKSICNKSLRKLILVFYLGYSMIVSNFIILKKGDRERDKDEENMVWGIYR